MTASGQASRAPTALAISPHADDASIFCGGTLARLASEGWRVVIARVTDDRYDSVGLPVDETIRRNAAELREAAGILGVAEVVDLGFETDCLADVRETVLRERIVYLLRRHRPRIVLSFDPADVREDNQDHARVAQATAEACWVAAFDKHHAAHFTEEGLAPFAPAEQWYFSRAEGLANHVFDLGDHLPRKVAAVRCHRTMLANVILQYRLRLRAAGRQVPMLDAAAASGDFDDLAEWFVVAGATAVAREAGLPDGQFAEAFRRERCGDLDALFDEAGEDLQPAPPEGP